MHILVEKQLEVTNYWSRHRVLEAQLSEIPAASPRADQVIALYDSLARFPLPPHLQMARQPWENVANLRWEELVALVAAELQQGVGQPPFRYYLTPEQQPPTLALECLEFEVASAVLNASARLVTSIQATGHCDVATEFARVRAADEQYSLGDATGPIVAAARRRGLPVLRLDDQSRIQFGQGIHARRIRKAATDVTGFVAEQASTDKAYTKQLWVGLGIPVPPGQVVADADEAMRAAEQLGWPVVVKPLDSDYSNGVTLNIRDLATVRTAYEFARKESESVLVERALDGTVHRFLIVDDQIVSAVRRDPAGVTGDGRSSIRQLVDIENQSPKRGPDERWPLHYLRLETEELAYLAEQGLSPDSVPLAGQRVELRREPYITMGGETHEVLDQVHPETLEIVRDAVRVIGLDVTGVDLIARDISLPLAVQGGGLLELNAQPAICLHLAPFNDKPQPVGEAIVQTLFPPSCAVSSGRIPLAIVVGNFCRPDELVSLSQMLSPHGQAVATSTPEATRILGRSLFPESNHPADRLATMYRHPRTTAACLAATAASLLEQGLGTDHCRLLSLMDSCAMDASSSVTKAKLAAMLARLLALTDVSLVNIDDPVWGALVEPGVPSMVMASMDPDHPMLRIHKDSGGTTAVFNRRSITFRAGNTEIGRLEGPMDGQNWLVVVAAWMLQSGSKPTRHSFEMTHVA